MEKHQKGDRAVKRINQQRGVGCILERAAFLIFRKLMQRLVIFQMFFRIDGWRGTLQTIKIC